MVQMLYDHCRLIYHPVQNIYRLNDVHLSAGHHQQGGEQHQNSAIDAFKNTASGDLSQASHQVCATASV